MKKSIFILLILSYSIQLCAQSAIKTLDEVLSSYKKQNNISMEVQYKFFAWKDTLKPVKTQKATISFYDTLYLYSLPNADVIKTEKYMILLDHEYKVLMAEYIPKNQSANLNLPIDSLLTQYDSLALTSKNTITMFSKYAIYEYVNIKFDEQTKRITDINIAFKKFEGNDKEDAIRFLNISFKIIPTIQKSKENLSYKRYITKVGNKWQPTERYKTYKFINHLN